jgi:hypothetical protein
MCMVSEGGFVKMSYFAINGAIAVR